MLSRFTQIHTHIESGAGVTFLRRLAFIAIPAVVAALLVAPNPTVIKSVKAATHCVNPGGTGGCFSSINAAIAAASANDTINVAAGTYNESVTVNKAGLILKGAQAGVSACGRSAPESIINQAATSPVIITANNVTLDGFTIQGAAGGFNSGIHINGAYSGSQILNNIIQNNVHGLYLNNNSAGNSTLVQGNSFKTNNNSGSASGNDIYSDQGLFNATITQNCFADSSTSAILITATSQVNNNITISNNVVTNSRAVILLMSSNVSITGNTASGAPISSSVSIGGGASNVTIERNTLINNAVRGISVSDSFTLGANTNVSIRCNRIVGNPSGGLMVFAGGYTGTLTAENNWWGCNAGPGGAGCDAVTNNSTATLDFNPWMLLSLQANPPLVSSGGTSTLTASLNTNSDGQTTPCNVPDATPVSFASTCGVTNPAATGTTNGSASSTLTSSTANTCSVSTKVDNQTVTLLINVQPPTVTITDPASCTGAGNVLDVVVKIANTGVTPLGASFTATLPAGLLALPGTCAANVGTCSVVNASTVSYNGTIPAGQTAMIGYQAQIANGVATGTTFTINTSANVGGKASNVTSPVTTNCPPAGPGLPLAASSPMSDQKAGSVLIYNVYTSSPTNSNAQNTRINITNTEPARTAYAHMFFVDGASCSVADSFICLTPNQTVTFLMSDLDPGIAGYIMVVATDAQGCPANFNFLIGDEYVKFSTGHAANLGAEAVSAIAGGAPLCNSQSSVTATLPFDGINYGVLPHAVAVDNIPSPANGNDTMLILNRLGGNLTTGAATLTSLFGLLYDDRETAYSFSFNPGTCQFRSTLSNNFPRTAPRLGTIISAGQSGWMRLWISGGTAGISGAVINFNPNAGSNSAAYNQGHNLHILTNTSAMVYTIPIFPPNC